MSPAGGPASIASLVAVVVVLVAVTLGAMSPALAASPPRSPATPSAARRELRAALFQTTYPASWRARAGHLRIAGTSVSDYSLSSTGAPLNADAIPPAGGIGITIYLYPERLVTRMLRLSSNRGVAALQLALVVVGIPRQAQYVTNIEPVRPVTLGGLPAGRITYLYEYADDYNLNLQDDVVALHGHTIVQVELDTAPALRERGESAFSALLRAWHWRAGQATGAR